MFPQQFEGAQFDSLKKEADVLGSKAVTKNSMQEPGYVQRPKLASASHPIKENKTGLPKMALPEKRLPGNLHDAFYPDICKTPTIPERDLPA
jgi:hypothetical protein